MVRSKWKVPFIHYKLLNQLLKNKKRLIVLFYLLMRDVYPTGQFRSILLKSLSFNLKNKIK